MSAPLHAPVFRLVVGLGNPGADYRDTRHNAGFMIVDRLAALAGSEFRVEKAWNAQVAKAGVVFYVKPQTYMNLSGQTVRAMSDFFKVPAAGILVILDDMALPLGRLRLRPSGSAGGHNGMSSIIAELGTQQVPRLRVGIGESPETGAAVRHVLGRFAPEEKVILEQTLSRAMEAVQCAQEHGIAAAMNSYN